MNRQAEYSDEESVDNCFDENREQDDEPEEVSDSDPDEFDCEVAIEVDESDYIDECPVNISHFELIKKLGTGAYGTVFLVRKNCESDADTIYALKVISKAQVVKVPKTVIHMKAERKALEILRHCPYIQKLYYAFQTGDKLFLVCEYLPGGEMFTQVQKGALPEHQVRFYIAELIVALEHIHLHGIVYRDIKLENVLMDAEGHVKLVDFGLCQKLGSRGRSKSFCGTEEYMAPEVIACTGHNSAADWWALGVLAIELLSTITPFGNSDGDNSIMEKITNEEPMMPPNISIEMEDFLLKLLTKDPTERLGGSEASAKKLKQHRLFSDIDWEKLENKLLPAPVIPRISSPTDTHMFSEEFTQQDATFEPSEVPPNSFLMFKGYSYIAPELLPIPKQSKHNLIDENLNSLTRLVLSNRDQDSKFYQKYTLASHQPLGHGKASVCMRCINVSDGTHCAVKIYKRQDQNYNEIDVLKKAAAKRVPGVVRLIEVLTDTKCTYLIMELIDGISLLEHLSTMSFNQKVIYDTFNALWNVVKSVHTQLKYTHGRICFQNFLYVESNNEFRLIGFSNAKPIVEVHHERIDYWSLGVCIYTVLCNHSPFNSLTTNETAMIDRIQKDNFDRSTKEWSALHKDVKAFIEQLLCSAVPLCSKEQLRLIKKYKNTSSRSVSFSKEKLDENKNIIKIRASRAMTLKPKVDIKVEMNHVANGVDIVINGVDSVQIEDDVKIANDENKVHHSQLKESRTIQNEMNGHIENLNTKRRSDQTDEQNGRSKPKGKKFKKDTVQPAEIVPTLKAEEIKQERVLRKRQPKNYSDSYNMSISGKKVDNKRVQSASETKADPIEVEDDYILLSKPKNKINEATTSRTRGRPKKDQSVVPTPTLPSKSKQTTKAPTIPKQHSAVPYRSAAQTNGSNTQDASRWKVVIKKDVNVPSRYNPWCFNYPRPIREGPVFYCFEKYTYSK